MYGWRKGDEGSCFAFDRRAVARCWVACGSRLYAMHANSTGLRLALTTTWLPLLPRSRARSPILSES
eukprot:1002895-Prymnesium_polylepis.2